MLEVRVEGRAPDEQPVGRVADRRFTTGGVRPSVRGRRRRSTESKRSRACTGSAALPSRSASIAALFQNVAIDWPCRFALVQCGSPRRERARVRAAAQGPRRSGPPGHPSRCSAAPRVAHGQPADPRCRPETEVHARILRGEVAASRLAPCRVNRRPSGSTAVTAAPGANRASFTSSQCPLGPCGARSTSLPPIVEMATSMRPSLPTSAAARPRPFRRKPAGPRAPRASPYLPPTGPSTRTGSASFARLVTGIAPAASTSAGLPVFGGRRRTRPSRRRRCQAPGRRRPAHSRTRASPQRVDTRPTARVASWSRRGCRPSERDTHARKRIGHAFRRAALLEAEAETGRVGLRAAGPGHVLVELVRVLVVCDVEIGAPVAVVVEELRRRARASAARPRGPPARRPRGTASVGPRSGRGGRERRRCSSGSRRASPGRDRSGRRSRRRRRPAGRRRSRRRRRRPCTSRTRRRLRAP